MADGDFLLALQLQEQFDNEVPASVWSDDTSDGYPLSKKRKVESSEWSVVSYNRPVQPERPLSIVDESWEMLDPNPDVRAMFLQFNDLFFWGKLSGVEVRWSPRMTLCAGVCSYEGRGGLCSIRLSEPLLKLRPRKDLVETLLHEMIHALLFVTQNNRDRDGHGPEFCKHMNRINQASGTKISVYHSFHDEVDVYRQHWWRCDGPCRTRKPFFGYVKRAMNRAPSARDPWWEDHRRTCGGTYTKIKEPENYGKKGKSEEKKDKNASKKPGDKIKPGSQDIRNIIPFSGRGIVLGGSTQPSAFIQKPAKIQSPTHSPKPLQEPARTSAADHLRSPYSVTTALPKRSVSNHKAFVNINGSPVRVTKTNGSLASPKQRTVRDLFQNAIPKSPGKTNPLEPKQASDSALNQNSAKTSLVSKSAASTSGSAGSPLSKYFGSAKSTGTGIPGQIKGQENGVPGFASGRSESHGSSATGISVSGSATRIKPGNGVPSSDFKYVGSPKSSGTGTPASSSTSIPPSSSSIHSESQRRSSTSSTDFGSRVPRSSLTCFGSQKDPGTGIPGSSSGSLIKSESGVPKSNSSQKSSGTGTSGASSSSFRSGAPSSNLKHFGSQRSSGTGAPSSVPSSKSRLSGTPEKSGAFLPASASTSPHKPGTATGGRKRWREDGNSTHIFDYFQRLSHSSASSSSPSSFSREHREEGTGAEVPSAGASGVGSTLLSSIAVTVTCPVCQSKVLESQINQHLDSCLM
ncbi:DNA-dependent metalloprotease SPRTN [Ictalurus furcatus]|uniref:DNA-dependent metalloprotease SPRTN n=1 Tax=Ictalurus furcatus TaxID=66913 RepID=UPI00234FC542|nr:DNA-dependent metalloprotease SPRTN [Ictalurus furcatus]